MPKGPEKRKKLYPTQVAQRLKCRYIQARDKMLTGKLGPTDFDERGKLFIYEDQFEVFEMSKGARRVGEGAKP